MQSVRIFENEQHTQIETLSNRIVNRLSLEYVDIINGMVAKKAKTKQTYIENAAHFIHYIQINGINSKTYGQYRNALEQLGDDFIGRRPFYLRAAKTLLRESVSEGILPVDITANVPQFKQATGHIKDGLNETEIRKVFQYIKTIKRESTRNKLAVMFQLFASEGLRQMELQQIKIEDINLKDATILIRGKGRDVKEPIQIFRTTAERLEAYINYLGRNDGYLFASKHKPSYPITLRAIRKMFTCNKYGVFVKSGITGRSVHGFRHFFTTKNLELNNGDLNKTALRTRHKTIATIKIYDDRRVTRDQMDKMETAFNFEEE